MKWAPVQTAAFAAHLAADLAIAWENKGRISQQDSVGRDTVYKTAITLAGAAVTLYTGNWPVREPRALPSPGPALPRR